MNKVRWGLLSTANINRRLIPAIRASARGELVAVASRTQEYAKAYAEKWDIPRAFGSYDAMLTSGDVDAVYIGLPNHMHAEWSIRAMQAGVHVLCEKPMTTSLEDLDAMADAAKNTGKSLAEAFMYRHHPQTKIIGEWIRSGRLGEICSVYATLTISLSDRANIRYVPEYGGGAVWDVGIYPLSFAQYVMKETPQWVFGSQLVGESGVDEHFSGLMQYTGNRTAEFICSFRSPFYAFAEIIGTEGRITIPSPFIIELTDPNPSFIPLKGDRHEIPIPKQELYVGEVEDMHAAILDGQPNFLSLTESHGHVKTALAVYQSALQNQVVYLNQ